MKNSGTWNTMKFTLNKYNRAKIIKDLVSYIHSIELKNPMNIEIKPRFKKRSNDQNSTYWVWMNIICKEFDGVVSPTEYDLQCKHNTFMENFLDPIGKSKSGRKIYSTKGLSTQQFSDYMENIRMMVMKYDLTLFYPSDPLYDELLREYNL